MARSQSLGLDLTTRALRSRVSLPRTPRSRRSARPLLEALEARIEMAVLTVNTLLDSSNVGPGLVTLRQAITASEDHTTTALGKTGTGDDTIEFDPALARE